MKSALKKLAVTGMAVLMTGTVCGNLTLSSQTVGNSAITASAAANFITDNTSSIYINDALIIVKKTSFSAVSKTFSTSVSNGVIKSTANVPVPILDSGTLTIKITGTGLTKAKLEAMSLTTTGTYGNYTSCPKTWNTVSQPAPPTVTKLSDTSYSVAFRINSYGTTLGFNTTALSGVSNLKVTSASYNSVSDSKNYYLLTADAPNGYDDLYIRIRRDNSVLDHQYRSWAKRLCVYANSLSYMTGIKHTANFLNYDDNINAGYGGSSNHMIDSTGKKFGFVGFNSDCAAMEKTIMKNDTKEILTWTSLHEISHTYAFSTDSNSFHKNYVYHDEALTNVRGLTALQNCENLNNSYLMFDGADQSIAKCQDALNKYNSIVPNQYFEFGLKMQNIAKKYNQRILEQFFGVSNTNVKKDLRFDSANNKNAAAVVNRLTGKNLSNDAYLKFVNNLRALYMISWNQKYDPYAFESFLTENFGKDFLKNYINFEIAQNKNFK